MVRLEFSLTERFTNKSSQVFFLSRHIHDLRDEPDGVHCEIEKENILAKMY